MYFGWRAMAINALRILKRKNTLENLIKTWAPPTENRTITYIKYVCNETSLSSTQKITTFLQLQSVFLAMFKMENGVSYEDVKSECTFKYSKSDDLLFGLMSGFYYVNGLLVD